MKPCRSLLLILCLALVAPVAAQADKTPKPKTPKLFITLTDGAMNRGKIVVPITASYSVPDNTHGGKACKGKINYKVPTGKKSVRKKGKLVKVVVYAKKSGTIRLRVDGMCSAPAELTIPAALAGKTLKFTASSKGNSVIKAFTKSKKLVVKVKQEPPVVVPPPTLKPGPWTITENFSGSTPRQWGVTIGADNTITKRTERYGTIPVHCPGPHADRILDDSPSNEAPFDDVNKITTNPFTAVDQWTNPLDTEEHATQTFTFNFTSETSGTGTYQVTGTLRATSLIAAPPDLVAGCASDVIQVHMEYGAAM